MTIELFALAAGGFFGALPGSWLLVVRFWALRAVFVGCMGLVVGSFGLSLNC